MINGENGPTYPELSAHCVKNLGLLSRDKQTISYILLCATNKLDLNIQCLTHHFHGISFASVGAEVMNMKVVILICMFLFVSFATKADAPVARGDWVSPAVNHGRIFFMVKKYLPLRHHASAQLITQTIIQEAKKHKIDPHIVTALIAGESSFNPLAIGPVGEVGLMQLRPSTAHWTARKMKLPWLGVSSLKNPVINIRLGMAYLSYLKKRFHGHGTHVYLAAYNMGETSVINFLAKNIQPEIYSRHVMKRYITLNTVVH